MNRFMCLLCCAVTLIAVASSASAREVGEGWLVYTDFQKALDTAAARDMPLCILYQFKESDCSIHEARAKVFEICPYFRDMLRVCVYSEYVGKMEAKTTQAFHSMSSRIDTIMVPRVFFTDGEGHILGYCSHDSPSNEWAAAAKTAKGIMAWKKKARASLEDLKNAISHARFRGVVAAIDRLVQEDKKMTALAEKSYPHKPEDMDSKGPDLSTLSEEERERVKKRMAEEAERKSRQFFYQEAEQLRSDFHAAVLLAYEEAEKHLAADQLTLALRGARSLFDCSVADMSAKARELERRILAAMKEAREKEASEEPPTIEE